MQRVYLKARESLTRRLRGQTLWEYILIVGLITSIMMFVMFLLYLMQQSPQ